MVTLPKKRIKVLVVDDSLMMRQVLSDILAGDPEIQVVGTAHDGKSALERVKALKPDVLTLDVEMPTMDGIECLRRLMKDNPTPVVMVSSITYQGGFKTMQALEAGAFDFIQKPKAQASSSLNAIADQIRQKLKTAVSSGYLAKKLRRPDPVESARQVTGASFDRLPPKLAALKSGQELVIAVGISTGGPPCVSKIFETLSKESPPVLVVQHMPEGFTKAMAERIDKVSSMRVKEAENGDLVKPGMGFIAPGHSHMLLVREAGELKIRLAKGDTVSGHRPSVDVLFGSVLEACGARAVAVIMTGMGRDGVSRLKDLRSAGAHTIAQDEASCVVFGMPRIAIQEDAVDEVLSLDGIAVRLQRIAKRA